MSILSAPPAAAVRRLHVDARAPRYKRWLLSAWVVSAASSAAGMGQHACMAVDASWGIGGGGSGNDVAADRAMLQQTGVGGDSG